MTDVLTWLGHSTAVLDLGGTRLLADPLLRRHSGPLRRRGPAPGRAVWDAPDVVLLSHLHHDHAELGSLRMLPAGVPVVTAPQNAEWLRRRGLAGVTPGSGGWYDVGPEGTVSVSLCRAVHHARAMPHRPNEVNGHLVRSPAARIWLAGDTELFDGLADLPDQAGGPIDLAVVPVSGWAPRLSGGHMGPAQAAEACAMVDARRAVPVHWGTLHVPFGRIYPRGWMDRAGPEFVDALRAVAPDCRPILVAPGGQIRLDWDGP